MQYSVRARGLPLAAAVVVGALSLSTCAGVAGPSPSPASAAGPTRAAAAPSSAQSREAYVKQGAGFEAKGELDKAFDSYAKAGDREALSRLSDALLKAGSYNLYVRCWQESRKTIVFRDEFVDNARSWNVRTDNYSTAAIKDGVLAVQRTKGNNTSYFWTANTMDPTADFAIETLVRRKAGSLNTCVGLSWGITDADANLQFGISGDGSYLYGGYTAGKWKARIDWKKSAAINTGFAANKLGVRRNGSRIEFSINDQVVDSAPFESLSGSRVGISVGTPLEVELDFYEVAQLPSAKEPLNIAGDAALAKGSVPEAVDLFAQAGNTGKLDEVAAAMLAQGRQDLALRALQGEGRTEAGARVQLASMLTQAGKRAEAVAQLDAAGWKLGQALSRSVVHETFDDNSREWAVLDDKSAKLQVARGVYHVESLPGSNGRNTWNAFPIQPDGDFKIETKIRRISGVENQTSSLIWGFKESSKRQDFGFTGSGDIEYGYFGDGKWHSVLSIPKSPAVKLGNTENVLAIVREGDVLWLSVNGRRVGQVPFRPFFGDNVGYGLYDAISTDVDSLDITEYPPEFALDLARTELYADRPREYDRAAAALEMDRGRYEKALAAYRALKDDVQVRECELRLGDEAAFAGKPADAVAHYQKAGTSIGALRGLASAYAALGEKDKVEPVKAGLADLLLAAGSAEEATALYRQLTKPALQDAAGARLASAGSFATAAELYKASGNAAKEKECYGRQAELSSRDGKVAEAIALYRKAGNESKAKGLEAKLVGLAASPQIGDTTNDDNVFALRVTDSGGVTTEIGEPSFSRETEMLKKGDNHSALDLSSIARVDFDWDKDKVSVKTLSGEVQSFEIDEGGSVDLKGWVYQAGISCPYRIEMDNVKSIARVSAAAPVEGHPRNETSWRADAKVTDTKGVVRELTDVRLYYKSSFDSGYSYWGVGSGIHCASMEDFPTLTLALGKGSYDVPLSRIASISFKEGSYLSDTGLRCPFVGRPSDLATVAGTTANGRVAIYPSSIAELSFSSSSGTPSSTGNASASSPKWSISWPGAAGSQAPLVLNNARAEVFSPAIEWGTTDGVLAFRAALEDYAEKGVPSSDRTSMVLEKMYECQSLPIQIGAAYWAVPFSAIKDFGVDSKGVLSITLKDDSVMKGSPYRNWKGLVGEGGTRLARKDMPARVSFGSPGRLYAGGIAVSGSLVESEQRPYGQAGYLQWEMKLLIENRSGAPIQFGKDILLMESAPDGSYDGMFVAYEPGAPGKDPAHSDFDAEAHSYALANFERYWSNGTLRGYRNGGTYMFGDPPDYKAERTICNSTLAAGANVKLAKEFTQGTWIDPHDRVLIALPVVSGKDGGRRLVLEFNKQDPSKADWTLVTCHELPMKADKLVPLAQAVLIDDALGVIALHLLADVDPAKAAALIDQNIRTMKAGLPLVASIQLLSNRGFAPSDAALAAIQGFAAGGKSWSAVVAKRYLGARN